MSLTQDTEFAGKILLESAEEFGVIISSTLTHNSSSIDSIHEPDIEKENIG